MSDKMRLPRLAAEAIELLRAQGMPLHEIASRKITNNLPLVNGYEKLIEMRNEVLLPALYHGYEVEETPEDRVREQYKTPRHFFNKDNDTESDIYRKGIMFTLNTLNIKIEGVNA